MTSFRDQSFATRFSALGDEAEGAFETWATEQGIKYVRFGLDRPDIPLARVPARIRYAPDYLTGDHLVEAQGVGRDRRFKLKLDKWGALHAWHGIMPVQLFVWDRTEQRKALLDLLTFDELLAGEGIWLDKFTAPDDGPLGKPYFSVPVDALIQAGEV